MKEGRDGGRLHGKAKARVPMTSLLLNVNAAAQLLGVSRNMVWQMDASGSIPAPIRIGRRCTRWRRDEIEAWVRAGCPSRERWQATR